MATQYVNCAVVGLLCLITSGAAAQPPIPIWGGSLAYQVLVEMTNYADSPDNPRWSFNYYYLVNGTSATNYSGVFSRYDIHNGNGDEVCVGISGAPPDGTPCHVIHSTNANWMYIMFSNHTTKERLFCCKCCQGIGAVRPDWLYSESTYEGLYKGADSYGNPLVPPPVGRRSADRWLKFGASDNNYYASDDKEQLPVRYNEHKHGQLKQWDFVLNTYQQRDDWLTNTPDIFEPPTDCENRCINSWCPLY